MNDVVETGNFVQEEGLHIGRYSTLAEMPIDSDSPDTCINVNISILFK